MPPVARRSRHAAPRARPRPRRRATGRAPLRPAGRRARTPRAERARRTARPGGRGTPRERLLAGARGTQCRADLERERREGSGAVGLRRRVEPMERRRWNLKRALAARQHRPAECPAPGSGAAGRAEAVLGVAREHFEVVALERWRMDERKVADAAHVELHGGRHVTRGALAITAPTRGQHADRAAETRRRAGRQRPHANAHRLAAHQHFAARHATASHCAGSLGPAAGSVNRATASPTVCAPLASG